MVNHPRSTVLAAGAFLFLFLLMGCEVQQPEAGDIYRHLETDWEVEVLSVGECESLYQQIRNFEEREDKSVVYDEADAKKLCFVYMERTYAGLEGHSTYFITPTTLLAREYEKIEAPE